MNTTKIEARINELRATPAALVGSDEGTHGNPRTYRIYETITGDRFGKTSLGGNNATDCTEASAAANTAGRMRHFPSATKEIRAKREELKKLEKARRELA